MFIESSCRLAVELPRIIGILLDRERSLARGRFREETLTDVFTATIAPFAGPSLVIEYPPEALTGGDLEIHFRSIRNARVLKVRIQAKRLNAATVQPKYRSYKELLHQVAGSGEYQFSTLVKTKGIIPLYMFYNHQSIVDHWSFSSLEPRVAGINLAFASDIASEMERKLAGVPNGRCFKRLHHLRQHFFELKTLFCPSGHSRYEVLSPNIIAESLRKVWIDSPMSDTKQSLRLSIEAPSFEPIDDTARRLDDGPAIRVNSDIARPIITVISEPTEDKRTPRIYGHIDE